MHLSIDQICCAATSQHPTQHKSVWKSQFRPARHSKRLPSRREDEKTRRLEEYPANTHQELGVCADSISIFTQGPRCGTSMDQPSPLHMPRGTESIYTRRIESEEQISKRWVNLAETVLGCPWSKIGYIQLGKGLGLYNQIYNNEI